MWRAIAIMLVLCAGVFAPPARAQEAEAAAEATNVQIKVVDGEAASAPAVSGAFVYLNGALIGKTSAKGLISTTVKKGAEAEIFAFSGVTGATRVVIGTTAKQNLVLSLTNGGLEKRVGLLIDGVSNAILPKKFGTSLILRPAKDGKKIPMRDVQNVQIYGRSPGSALPDSYGQDWFANATVLGDGSVRILIDEALGAWLSSISQQLITVSISGTGKDTPYFVTAQTSFQLGLYKLTGKIAPPPSNPDLKVSGAVISATVLGSERKLVATTDSKGRFSFSDLPFGTLSLGALIKEGKLGYAVFAELQMSEDQNVTVYALGFDDVVKGAPAASVRKPTSSGAPSPERQKYAETRSGVTPNRASEAAKSCPEQLEDVSVSAGSQDVPVFKTATMTVPKGKETIKVRYNVSSDEYPHYVLQQSKFNDVWAVVVSTPSNPAAKRIVRRVNAQVSQEPKWLPDGTTGDIEFEVDVSNDTKTSEAKVALSVMAMNIGDSILDTEVDASLILPKLDVSMQVSLGSGKIADVFSLPVNQPPSGSGGVKGRNTFAKRLKLSFTGVKADALAPLKVYVEAPGVSATPIVDTAKTPQAFTKTGDQSAELLVTATSPNPLFPLSLAPANFFNTFKYKVAYETKGSKPCLFEFESPSATALYRGPSIGRYSSKRDLGGDDWLAPGAYDWLTENSDLRYDDISGEHGVDIGHDGHMRGLNIDLLQFYGASTATGCDNYTAVRNAAITAMIGNTANKREDARQKLIGFIEAQRNGLERLNNDTSVLKIYAGNGEPSCVKGVGFSKTLPTNWLRDLILTGKTQTTKGPLEVGGGSFLTKVSFNRIHNNHNHVDVRPR